MYIRWDPENGEPAREWDFDPEDLLKSEGKAIEKAYGHSVEQWLQAIRTKQVSAREVLLWHLLRLEHKNLAIKDVPDFRLRQMKVEMSSKELRTLAERMGKMKFSDDTMEQLQAAFDLDIADAIRRETGVEEGEIIDAGTEVSIRPKDL